MQRRLLRRVAGCWHWAVVAVTPFVVSGVARAADPSLGALRWPLAAARRVLTGGFGESRTSRFHAGLDLSTGGKVGAEVLAPAAASVERVRASGVGYGRSLYLRTDDDRLLVFGHLDAFAPAVAAYVDSVQRVTGDYEQDLWPTPGRFRFVAGALVAWSGQSGAGPPHLHVEVRHGDMAINPLLAGLAVSDTVPPRLERLLLEPLDDHSWVARHASPHAVALRATPETLVVEGRARLTLVASDATNHSHGLPVRTVGARWGDAWVKCDMDSVSWAGEMGQYGWLIDRDRVAGSEGVILDAPAGFRPRFLSSSRPLAEAVELVSVRAGDPPRPLDLHARDAAGNETARRVWLRGPRPQEAGPDTTAPVARAPVRSAGRKRAAVAASKPSASPTPRWSFACLPDQHARVRVTGAPPGLSGVRIERGAPNFAGAGARATWDGAGWTAVMNLNGTPDPDGYWIKGRAPDGKAWWQRGSYALWPTSSPMTTRVEDWAWFHVDPTEAYEMGVAMVRTMPIADLPAGATGNRATVDVQPSSMPLRRPVTLLMVLAPGVPHERFGICRRDGDGDAWEWNDARWDSVGRTLRVNTTRLGQFAMIRDDAPPEVTVLATPKVARRGTYSTWALTARARDRLSGVSAEASAFFVDGVRVPTEYDAEGGVLRWRPRTAPKAGRHAYRLVVADETGNRTVRSGGFVIASRRPQARGG